MKAAVLRPRPADTRVVECRFCGGPLVSRVQAAEKLMSIADGAPVLADSPSRGEALDYLSRVIEHAKASAALMGSVTQELLGAHADCIAHASQALEGKHVST